MKDKNYLWAASACMILSVVFLIISTVELVVKEYKETKTKEIIETVEYCQDSKLKIFFDTEGSIITGIGCGPFPDHPEAPIGLKLPSTNRYMWE